MKKPIFNDWNDIAHRGLHYDNIPENSILAFQEAIQYHYAIELDVHLLKDDNVIVFYDDNLKRMTKIDIKTKDLTYEEIKQINLLDTNERIPLLEDVLELINGQVPLLIELKCDQKVGKLENKVIKLLKNYKGKYYFQSFRLRSLLYIKRKVINSTIGLLVHSKQNKVYKMFMNLFFIKLLKIDFISYPIKKLPNKKIEKLYKKIPILIWTVKKPDNRHLTIQYKDGIIFERNNSCEMF